MVHEYAKLQASSALFRETEKITHDAAIIDTAREARTPP